MSEIIRNLLNDIPLPRMLKVRQKFDPSKLDDPLEVLRGELHKPGGIEKIKSGDKVAENDLYAIKAAVKTCNILDYTQCRMVRIRDTLHLGEIWISETLYEEAKAHPDVEIISSHDELTFDNMGFLPK